MGDERNVIRFAWGAPPGAPAPLSPSPAGDDADLLEYARVLWKHRRWLAGGVFAVMVATAVVNLLLAPVYRATATVLPVTGTQGPTIPSAVLQAFGASGLSSALKGQDPTDRFVAILKSETVAEGVLDKLQLLPVLFADDWDAAAGAWREPDDPPDVRDGLRKLREDVLSVDTTAEGAIEIAAEWTDAALAARIANQAVAELEAFLQEKDLSLAARHRQFVEARRLESRKLLAEAEDALRAFSEKHGLVSVSEQTRALFETIGQVQARILIDQSHIDAMREFRGPSDPDLRLLELGVASLKNRLTELEHGVKPDPGVQVQANGLVPMYKLPEIGLEYARHLREVTVQNEVFTLLAGELERAKIEERREEIAVQVLDPAREPDEKHRPRRTQNTLLAGVVAAFLGVLLAFGAEGVQKLRARAVADVAARGSAPPPPAPAIGGADLPARPGDVGPPPPAGP